jgi:hypothetical protein
MVLMYNGKFCAQLKYNSDNNETNVLITNESVITERPRIYEGNIEEIIEAMKKEGFSLEIAVN